MPYSYGGGGIAEFDLVPEGTHEFFIDSIIEKRSKSNRPMVEIVLKPSEISMQKFGKVWHYIMLDNEYSESNVGRLLAAIGKDPGRPGRIDFADFKGEYLEAEIRHQDDERYGAKAVVKKLLSRFSSDDAPPSSTSTVETRDQVRGDDRRDPPNMPQDDHAGNYLSGDDIPF